MDIAAAALCLRHPEHSQGNFRPGVLPDLYPVDRGYFCVVEHIAVLVGTEGERKLLQHGRAELDFLSGYDVMNHLQGSLKNLVVLQLNRGAVGQFQGSSDSVRPGEGPDGSDVLR